MLPNWTYLRASTSDLPVKSWCSTNNRKTSRLNSVLWINIINKFKFFYKFIPKWPNKGHIMIELSRTDKELLMGYSRKNPHTTPPDRLGSFFNSPSHLEFLKHKTPPSCLDFQDKRLPLPPGFPWKIIRLKFNLFSIENTHSHV